MRLKFILFFIFSFFDLAFAGQTFPDYVQGGSIRLSANTVSSRNTNGNILLTPNGTGQVWLNSLSARLVDNTDNSKRVNFVLSGITTGQTRTVTFPDADLTVVGTSTTQTLSNKTISNPLLAGDVDFITNARSRFYPSSGTTFVGLRAPSSIGTSFTLSLPNALPSAGQFLRASDGSGNLEFVNAPGKTLVIPAVVTTSPYSAVNTDDLILVNRSSAGTVFTYTASGATGSVIRVKNIGTANITLDGFGSETISGQDTKILLPQELIEIVSDGTNWRVMSFRSRGVVTVTSSTLTPGGSARWHTMTGNSFTLTRGRWMIVGKCDFGNNGSTPAYSTLAVVLSSANGANTATRPADLSATSAVSLVGLDLSFTNVIDGLTVPNNFHSIAPVVVDVTADTSGSIFVNAYSAQTTSANSRITVYATAWKIGD